MTVLTAHITEAVILVGIGINADEQNRKQRLSVSCEIEFSPSVWPVKTVDDCYNYAPLCGYLTETVPNLPHIDLIETLLHDIATFIFDDKRVTRVKVSLYKPDILPNTAGVGVTFGPCTRADWYASL